uniref:Movement protein TGBp3 n=1 Tax=Tagetes carlavirus 1 TaxID=2794422 RepID=A0A7T5QZ84_9VIRU|nr:TGB3 [Tagetes carlavirus 1]
MHDNTILLLALILIICCVITFLRPTDPCTISITGEAVRVSNCAITAELLAFAREAKPAGSC